jgi:hypothetical protein
MSPGKEPRGFMEVRAAHDSRSSLVSLLSSFVAIQQLGIADFGQWLSWRSLFLLLAIPTPGFNVAQQVLVAEARAVGDMVRAYRERAAAALALSDDTILEKMEKLGTDRMEAVTGEVE